MNKKVLLIVGILAVVSFAVSLILGMMLTEPPPPPEVVQEEAPQAPLGVSAGLAGTTAKLTPREKQLEELIRDLQNRITDYTLKSSGLDQERKRLEMAQQQLNKQAQDLESLRIEILTPLAALRDEQARLDQSRLKIQQEERVNIRRAAAIYEKMDAESGSRILAGMAAGTQLDDAVKILYYMSEKSAARIFTEMTDKELAGRLTLRLKQIREEG
ncbi:MAG: hypothetical protein GXY38_06980 [Planctomycetes bacterium]|jgi:flagellar motility protein MotE (MotC chaperone)|nr:hypothetical protein [Planctomycetota bacterium]